ncbi:gag-pol polyprotein [Tanacetum coccineum]
MAETIEQYMSKTRADYGLGVVRPKIKDKDKFELKGQFLKELRTNTFSGSDHEDANKHIEKVLEIVDLFHNPNITIDQVMLKAFPMSLTGALIRWLRNTPTGSITTWEDLKTKGAIPLKTAADAKTTIQERAEYSKKWHNGTSRVRSTETSDRLAAIQAQLNNLGRKIKKVLQERGFGSLPSSTEANLRDQVKSISTTIETDSCPICRIRASQYTTVKYPKGIAENVLVRIGKFTFLVDFIILDMPENIKVPLILGRPFLSTAHAKIDVYKRNITLRVGEERIVFTSVKPASSLIKRVYMLSLRERMELDLEARLMGETLVLNRSLDYFLEDYIESNDLNEPFKLRKNQGDDLMPTIEEGEVIEEFRTRDDELDIGIDDYPSYCDYDKKIHIDYLRKVGIKTNRFKGIITLYNGNDEVTYQMVRSHPRFKRHTNEQCNKIPPLLKVSKKDEVNGISHAYQKLKGFYKGVLNLRPDYIRDAKMEEWLTCGHISLHEME